MKLSIAHMREQLFDAHRDEGGAVALLCLAAVLALAMIAWSIVDVHKSTRDKVMLQGAADTAAFSHAAVEARSMNMIAYANIAKRSAVGMHSLYPGMFFVYTVWLIDQASGCQPVPVPFPPGVVPKNPVKCARFIANAPMWVVEATGDHVAYSGDPFTPYAGGVVQTVADILSWIDSIPFVNLGLGDAVSDAGSGLVRGNAKNAHARDVKALDNYQHYMTHITPWWAWSEQLSRGWRSGATTVASFPPPPGDITVTLSAVQNIINTVNSILSIFGGPTIDLSVYHGNDNLPITKEDYSWCNWLSQMFLGDDGCLSALPGSFSDLRTMGNEAYILEHIANTYIHRSRSDMGAKRWSNVIGGATLGFATMGIQFTRLAFGDAGDPYTIDSDTITSEAQWLKHTSNLVFAYSNDTKRMDEDRAKLSVPAQEYTHGGGFVDELMYDSSGYWTMAKSEITFNGEGWRPDMWHPSWTARMRPVHLPGEFNDGGYNMNIAYNHALPYLALSAQIASIQGSGSVNAILNSIRDFAFMELSTAAMGPSTIEGFGK